MNDYNEECYIADRQDVLNMLDGLREFIEDLPAPGNDPLPSGTCDVTRWLNERLADLDTRYRTTMAKVFESSCA